MLTFAQLPDKLPAKLPRSSINDAKLPNPFPCFVVIDTVTSSTSRDSTIFVLLFSCLEVSLRRVSRAAYVRVARTTSARKMAVLTSKQSLGETPNINDIARHRPMW